MIYGAFSVYVYGNTRAMENKIDFMQELYKIILDAVKKQAFSVLLLMGVTVGMWEVWMNEKHEMAAALAIKEDKCARAIEEMRVKNMACDEALRDALIRIARLEAAGEKSR